MLEMEMWTYRVDVGRHVDLTGYEVEALDGRIGKIDEATYETGQSCVVVDTGFWIFGKKRMLPAGFIDRIDPEDKTVYVNLTKDEIKSAPDWDAVEGQSETHRGDVGSYYERGGSARRR
jgi:hypothetical protein